MKYNYIGEFNDGLAMVFIGKLEMSIAESIYPTKGKYGFINQKGEEIIPLKYDDAMSFSDGKAQVELNNKTFYETFARCFHL